jgi:hypothetical protein
MLNEVTQKEVTKKKKTVGMRVEGIPLSVHKKLIDYRAKINFERKKAYNLVDAYREFLIEKTKDL